MDCKNNSEIKVSVIICAYNASESINRCLQSLRVQTHKNIQFILVDDGSTDETGEILSAFALETSGKYIRIENSGVSTARNVGLSAVDGKYFTFVDADDIISPSHVENLLTLAEENDAEMSICGFVRLKEKKAKRYNFKNKKAPAKIYDNVSALEQYFTQKEFDFVLWNKLYKTETLLSSNACFLDGTRYGEETPFIYNFLKNAKRVSYSPKVTYIYVQNDKSLMHQKFNENRFHLYDNINTYIEDCKNNFPSVYPYVSYMRSGYSCGFLYFMKKYKYKNAEKISLVVKTLGEDIKQYKKCSKGAKYRKIFIPLVYRLSKLIFRKKLKENKK